MPKINVVLEDAEGNLLQSFDDEDNPVDLMVVDDGSLWQSIHGRGGMCLPFIDPYGDTWFNHLQRPLLQRDLEETILANPSGSGRRMLDEILRLIEATKRQQYSNGYVHFIGE